MQFGLIEQSFISVAVCVSLTIDLITNISGTTRHISLKFYRLKVQAIEQIETNVFKNARHEGIEKPLAQQKSLTHKYNSNMQG